MIISQSVVILQGLYNFTDQSTNILQRFEVNCFVLGHKVGHWPYVVNSPLGPEARLPNYFWKTLNEIMDILPWMDTVLKHDTTEEIYSDNFKLEKKPWFFDQDSVYKAFLNPSEKGTFWIKVVFLLLKNVYFRHEIFTCVLIANIHTSMCQRSEMYLPKIVCFSGSNQQDFQKSKRDKGICFIYPVQESDRSMERAILK
jgi:hypothetical protein